MDARRAARPRPEAARPVPITDALAQRKNLSKTRAVMMMQAPSRLHPILGRGARVRLLSGLIAACTCVAAGCGDDDPAPQTGIGGSAGSAPIDASVRDLPGDGIEPTPEFDIEVRQRRPPGPQRLNEAIDRIRNPGSDASVDQPDAAPGATLDAGAS